LLKIPSRDINMHSTCFYFGLNIECGPSILVPSKSTDEKKFFHPLPLPRIHSMKLCRPLFHMNSFLVLYFHFIPFTIQGYPTKSKKICTLLMKIGQNPKIWLKRLYYYCEFLIHQVVDIVI